MRLMSGQRAARHNPHCQSARGSIQWTQPLAIATVEMYGRVMSADQHNDDECSTAS